MDAIVKYEERHKALVAVEDSKNNLIKDLIRENADLARKLDEKGSDLEREANNCRSYYQQNHNQKIELEELRRKMDKNAFVSVLIDGDSMQFKDELVQDLAAGGEEAAVLLNKSIETFLRADDVPTLPSHYNVVVRIYVNMIGLSRKYCREGILGSQDCFEFFIRGFNKTYPLFEIVDAGNEKECSDNKVRNVFEMDVRNVHCRHILFGGPRDAGYIRQLKPHAMDESVRGRITLLEGPGFEKAYVDLVRRLRTHRFDDVFRKEQLESASRKVSFSKTPPRSPGQALLRSPLPAVEPSDSALKESRAPSYASTIVAGGSSGFRVCNVTSSPIPSKYGVLRNVKGQRIDPPLKCSSALVSELKLQKLCNRFHLLNDCSFEPCQHTHGPRLNTEQLNALRYIARSTFCIWGSECEDENCLSGHSCPLNPCTWGRDCKFPRELHGIDKKPSN